MIKTHELKIYANNKHCRAKEGELILYLWFVGETTMKMDLDIALHRPDVAYVDLIDLQKYTTERLFP